ncbi:hypothetical protein MOQ_008623, partial [Trypanosoma cruzi marinkellei]
MRSRCTATSTTNSSQSSSSVTATSLTIAACHGHAQHTQHHNVVPPLLPNHERNAPRILALVPHALQPLTDQPHRHELQLVAHVLGADTPILSVHGLVLQGAAERSHRCKRPQCTRRSRQPPTLSPSQLPAPSTRPHTRAVPWERKRSPPHNTCINAGAAATPSTSHCKREPCAPHTHSRNESDG